MEMVPSPLSSTEDQISGKDLKVVAKESGRERVAETILNSCSDEDDGLSDFGELTFRICRVFLLECILKSFSSSSSNQSFPVK